MSLLSPARESLARCRCEPDVRGCSGARIHTKFLSLLVTVRRKAGKCVPCGPAPAAAGGWTASDLSQSTSASEESQQWFFCELSGYCAPFVPAATPSGGAISGGVRSTSPQGPYGWYE